MYSYTKKNKRLKKYAISTLSLALVATICGLSYLALNQGKEVDLPVSANKDTIPVIALPQRTEKAIRPYKVDATIVLDYFDGEESDVESMTKFEGVYRANQGIDYGFQKESFDVFAIFSGEVTDVKEDPLFGHSCTIKSGDLSITYQSLQDMKRQVGDKVQQGDALSLASENIYNKDLGNHVHIVVENKGERMDPESLYDKTLDELK